MKVSSTKQLAFLLAVLCSVLFFSASPLAGQSEGIFDINESPLEKPTSPIMDYANAVDESTEKRIRQKLIDFSKRSNPKVELAVAVVDTTGGVPIFDYSLAVARGWKIGSAAADNPSGLLFIAVSDRKYFTHVSYDLEDELSDGVVGSLQRTYLVPEFKKGNYGKGIEDTIDAYINTIEGKQDPNAIAQEDTESAGMDSEDLFCCGIVVIAFIIFIVMVVVRVNRNGGGKGGKGGKRGGDWGNAAGEVAIDIIGGLVLGALSGGGSGSSSSSSSWSDNSSGSSGGDWGGFGGGGDFGGGGAGGSW